MSNKRKRERRRAIAAQRSAAKISDAGLGVSRRKVVSTVLPGVSRPAVTSANVRDVPTPRRLFPPSSFKAPSVSVRAPTAKPVRAPSSSPARLAGVSSAKPAPSASPARRAVALSSPAKPFAPRPSPAIASVQPSKPVSSVSTSRTLQNTCKPRPSSSSSKGGGSRSFIPWCR